ncbi:MAG: universal stress protein [Thiolinea sp.]
MNYRNIIVAVDNDESNEIICGRANELARALGATLSLIYVMEPLPPLASAGAIGGAPFPLEVGDEEYQEGLKSARQVLADLASKFSETITAHKVIEAPGTRDAIHDEARECGADLIIAGSHGRHGFSLLFHGSTTSALLHDAPCDVLAVRITEES